LLLPLPLPPLLLPPVVVLLEPLVELFGLL
jgi:hypothetical protein